MLKLESKNGTTFFVWATPSIIYAVKKRKTTQFIFNLGAKISDATGSLIYDFKLQKQILSEKNKEMIVLHRVTFMRDVALLGNVTVTRDVA